MSREGSKVTSRKRGSKSDKHREWAWPEAEGRWEDIPEPDYSIEHEYAAPLDPDGIEPGDSNRDFPEYATDANAPQKVRKEEYKGKEKSKGKEKELEHEDSDDYDPNDINPYANVGASQREATQLGSVYEPEPMSDSYSYPIPKASSTSIDLLTSNTQDAEELDPRYKLHPSAKFQPGEVFKVLWAEPSGSIEGAPTISETVGDRHGESFYVGFRRFIVISNDEGHSTCVPISTYGGRGCKKRGTKPHKHGIIVQSGRKPTTLSGEPELGFAPVRLKFDVPGERIAKESRINYSKLVTVEHSVKVFFIGSIVHSDWGTVSEAVNKCWEAKIHKSRQSKEQGESIQVGTTVKKDKTMESSDIDEPNARMSGQLEMAPEFASEDDEISVSSASPSVFSIPSAPTSISSSRETQDIISARELLVDLFTGDNELDQLFRMCMENSQIGPEGFQRNFPRMLKDYGTQLADSAVEHLHVHSARLLTRNANKVSKTIRHRYDPEHRPLQDMHKAGGGMSADDKARLVDAYLQQLKNVTGPDRFQNETDDFHQKVDHDDDDYDVLGGEIKYQHLDDVRCYLISGEPFKHLKIRFRQFVQPIPPLVEYAIEVVFENEDVAMLVSRIAASDTTGRIDKKNGLSSIISNFWSNLQVESQRNSELVLTHIFAEHSKLLCSQSLHRIPTSSFVTPIDLDSNDPKPSLTAKLTARIERERLQLGDRRRGHPKSYTLKLGFLEMTINWAGQNAANEQSSETIATLTYKKATQTLCDSRPEGDSYFQTTRKPSMAPYPPAKNPRTPACPMLFMMRTSDGMDLITIKNFILKSKSISQLKSALRETLKDCTQSAFCFQTQSLVDPNLKNAAELKTRLSSIVSELYYANPDELKLVLLDNVSWVDQLKVWVEKRTGSEWDWQPLGKPLRQMVHGHQARLTWKCSCGRPRVETLKASLALELAELFEIQPMTCAFNSRNEDGDAISMTKTSTQPSGGSSISDSGSGSEPTDQNPPPSTHGSNRDSNRDSPITPPSSFGAFDDSPIPVASESLRFIFLLVRASRYQLAQIETYGMKTTTLFRTLQKTYIKLRGTFWGIPWRYLLSIYVFYYCDFVKVEKYGPHRFSPGDTPELPSDPVYFYKQCDSIPEDRPISRHMFEDLFYACYGGDSVWHNLHSRFCRPLVNLPNLLERIPRRCFPIPEHCSVGDVEVFWGIVARERISFMKVVLYSALSMIPSIWFAFYWMFGWGHDGDLQNAFIPAFTTLGMLTMVLGAIFAGTERKVHVD